MGGSSKQVIGYKYLTNFLLFIGNPIESLLGINFDKRMWITGKRVPMGDNGTMIYLHSPTLYGENEGGVSGTLCLKLGTNTQAPDAAYKKYMELIGLQASAYPYQSYISFSGGELLEKLESLTDEQLQELADQHNDGIIPGRGFYVGNSGYMKEMLLWPKRIHVRNDGREQWYPLTAGIGESNEDSGCGYIEETYIALKGEWGRINGTTSVIPEASSNRGHDGYNRGSGYVEIRFNTATKDEILVNFNRFLLCSGASLSVTSSPFIKILGYEVENVEDYWDKQINNMKFIIKPCPLITHWIRFDFTFQDVASAEYATPPYKLSEWYFDSFLGIVPTSGYTCWMIGDGIDINPIHKIREILTDDTAMNKPESSVNNENFIKAADRIFNEGVGISWSITEKSCMDAINELCYHIEAGVRVNRQTGLYEMVLFRDDWFKEDEIHTISESKIKNMQYEITNADEVINQVNVNYYDRKNIKNSSFSISESGLIQTLGRVNAETVDFPYFMTMRNAEIVANWKLKILSTGVLKGSLTTGWREARKWNRYDLIRLPWSKRWTGTIFVRIMSINLGGPTNNEVSIEFIEVVPATGMMNTTIVIDNPINTQPEAPKPCNAKVFELPCFEAVQAFGEREVGIELAENPEIGYLCAIAEKPQNNSLNAALYTGSGSGFERATTVNYCETAYLDQVINRINNTFIVKNVGNIASVRVGSQIFINDEIMVYQSYDSKTKILTVKRGAFGVPQNHSINSILYFADDFIAVDQTLYVQSEIVDAKVLTTTPSGILPLSDAEIHEVDFNSRAIRPYPPANVKINDEYWPSLVQGNINLTWAHRNRLQQTGGEIIGWFDSGVSVESGVTYIVNLYNSANELLVSKTTELNSIIINQGDFTATNIRLEIISIRDGYESFQKFEHVFAVKSAANQLEFTHNYIRPVGNNVELIFEVKQ